MRLTLNRSCVVTAAAVLGLLAGSVAQDAQLHLKATVRPGVVPGPMSVHQPFVSKELPKVLKEALNGVGVPSMVAISDFGASFIDIFQEDGTILATLTGNGLSAPEGMDTDRLGNLYVCNAGNRDILTYAAGFTALDVMSMRIPVLADRDTVAARYVADGITGALLNPGDALGTAAVVAGLLALDERRHAMGSAGRARVAREYTEPAMVDALQGAADTARDRTRWAG